MKIGSLSVYNTCFFNPKIVNIYIETKKISWIKYKIWTYINISFKFKFKFIISIRTSNRDIAHCKTGLLSLYSPYYYYWGQWALQGLVNLIKSSHVKSSQSVSQVKSLHKRLILRLLQTRHHRWPLFFVALYFWLIT